jgi:hypothetical protein
MSHPVIRLVALPLALLLASSGIAQETSAAKPAQKHMVRFSFKAGTVQHSVIHQDMTMTMNMGGEDMVTNMQTSMWSTVTTKATKGSIADTEQWFTRVKFLADNIVMKVNYDSDDPDSDPGQMEALADLVGQKMSWKLSDQGKVSNVVMPEDSEEFQAAGVDLAQIMSQTVTQLPDHPIAIGETWQVKQTTKAGQLGDIESVTHYKLTAITKEAITLQLTVKFDIEAMQLPGGAAIEKLETTGTSKISLQTGMPLEMDQSMTMKMGGAMSMVMKMKQSLKPAPAPTKKDAAKPDKSEKPGKPGK